MQAAAAALSRLTDNARLCSVWCGDCTSTSSIINQMLVSSGRAVLCVCPEIWIPGRGQILISTVSIEAAAAIISKVNISKAVQCSIGPTSDSLLAKYSGCSFSTGDSFYMLKMWPPMPFVWAIINAIPHSFIGTPLIYLVQSCRWWKHSISCGEHSGCCSRWSYCGQMLGSGSFVTFLPFCLPPPPPCWRAAHRKYKIWFK